MFGQRRSEVLMHEELKQLVQQRIESCEKRAAAW